jgi:hypothetical protein
VPVHAAVPVQAIASRAPNGPYSDACTVAVCPASPLTITRSWIAVPGATRWLLTIVCTRGCASTRTVSPAARHGDVTPMWASSPETAATYA